MIEMFVHQDRPFIRREWPKKGVRMGGAACGACSDKPVDESAQAITLSFKIPFPSHDKLFGGGRIPAKWFIVTNDDPLDRRSDDSPDKRSPGADFPGRHLQRG